VRHADQRVVNGSGGRLLCTVIPTGANLVKIFSASVLFYEVFPEEINMSKRICFSERISTSVLVRMLFNIYVTVLNVACCFSLMTAH
jgi:hypothetical protein